jgi:hypothetical protein
MPNGIRNNRDDAIYILLILRVGQFCKTMPRFVQFILNTKLNNRRDDAIDTFISQSSVTPVPGMMRLIMNGQK